MNLQIYRINVKEDLYFLCEDTDMDNDYDFFYKTIKDAQENIRNHVGWVRRRDGMAVIAYEKQGIVRCRKLLPEYSLVKKEKKKKPEAFNTDDMWYVASPVEQARSLAQQANAWQQVYTAQFNNDLETFQDNNNPVTVAELPPLEYDMSVTQDFLDQVRRADEERVARDSELNRNTVRSYINRMRGMSS